MERVTISIKSLAFVKKRLTVGKHRVIYTVCPFSLAMDFWSFVFERPILGYHTKAHISGLHSENTPIKPRKTYLVT